MLRPIVHPAAAAASTTDGAITDSVSRAELSMLFRGASIDDFSTWKGQFRQRLEALLGDSTPPTDYTIIEESVSVLADHTRIDLLLSSDGVPPVPVYLLVPAGLNPGERAPAVLAIHGHGDYGHHTIVGRTDLEGVTESIEQHNYDYGLQFVRRGYVVVAPCLIPFGRRVDRAPYAGNDPCAVTFVRMQSIGQLPITANLRDLRWCLDLLQSRADVNAAAIGCAGLSYGGRMAMLVAALEQRVKVVAVSGQLNLLQERMTLRHSCGSQMIPGLLNYGDYSEIGSLIAPRPSVWENGSEDPGIPPKWEHVFRRRLERAYSAAAAPEALYFDDFEGGHVWNGRVAFPLFERVLRGHGRSEAAPGTTPLIELD